MGQLFWMGEFELLSSLTTRWQVSLLWLICQSSGLALALNGSVLVNAYNVNLMYVLSTQNPVHMIRNRHLLKHIYIMHIFVVWRYGVILWSNLLCWQVDYFIISNGFHQNKCHTNDSLWHFINGPPAIFGSVGMATKWPVLKWANLWMQNVLLDTACASLGITWNWRGL